MYTTYCLCIFLANLDQNSQKLEERNMSQILVIVSMLIFLGEMISASLSDVIFSKFKYTTLELRYSNY